MKDKVSTMVMVKENYGIHPCGTRFCKKCDWILIPPAYKGDYWDCTNSDCGESYPPSKTDLKRM